MRRAALAVAGVLVACAPDEAPAPLPLEVRVAPVGTSTQADAPLRLAVIYKRGEDLEVTHDLALTATGTPVRLRIDAPEDLDFEPAPPEILTYSEAGDQLRVYRARFVIYADRDGSGDFQIGDAVRGPDQVLGVDGYLSGSPPLGAAWVLRFDAQFSALPPESIARYYEVTGDRYTDLLHVRQASNGQLVSAPASELVVVDISRPAVALTDLACDRALRFAGSMPSEVTVLVGGDLDPRTLCALEVADCQPVDLFDLEPPDLSADPDALDVATFVQCRRSLGVEVLVLEARRTVCDVDACRCAAQATARAIATSTAAAVPDWWPCGRTVDICEVPDTPLYRADRACEPNDE